MIFASPRPFAEALQSAEVKAVLPTAASSLQLMAIAPQLRERARFSARTTNAGYLQRIDDLITRIVSPETVTDPATGDRRPARPGEYMDPATARLELKQALDATGYQPDPALRGTLRDLSSDLRLNLIIDTNVRMAHGYGRWQQGQDPTVLDQWPAQELYRAEERIEKRDWISRWREAGGKLSGGGRMIALKNAPIWTAISAFGLPYAPFDFGSGMDVRDVDRDEAAALGLIDRDTQIEPETRGFNEDLEVSAPERQGALFTALLQSLGDAAAFVDGVLRLKV